MNLSKFLYSRDGCSLTMKVFTEFCTCIINYFLVDLPTMCTQILWWNWNYSNELYIFFHDLFPLPFHYFLITQYCSFLVFFINVMLYSQSYLHICTNTLEASTHKWDRTWWFLPSEFKWLCLILLLSQVYISYKFHYFVLF